MTKAIIIIILAAAVIGGTVWIGHLDRKIETLEAQLPAPAQTTSAAPVADGIYRVAGGVAQRCAVRRFKQTKEDAPRQFDIECDLQEWELSEKE